VPIEEFLTNLTGKDRKATIAAGSCTTCDSPDMNFREEIDRREYSMSGMCQKCQDVAFAPDPDDEEGDDYIPHD